MRPTIVAWGRWLSKYYALDGQEEGENNMKHAGKVNTELELTQLEAQRVVWWKAAEIAQADGHMALADWFDNRATMHKEILTNASLVLVHPMNRLTAEEPGKGAVE